VNINPSLDKSNTTESVNVSKNGNATTISPPKELNFEYLFCNKKEQVVNMIIPFLSFDAQFLLKLGNPIPFSPSTEKDKEKWEDQD